MKNHRLVTLAVLAFLLAGEAWADAPAAGAGGEVAATGSGQLIPPEAGATIPARAAYHRLMRLADYLKWREVRDFGFYLESRIKAEMERNGLDDFDQARGYAGFLGGPLRGSIFQLPMIYDFYERNIKTLTKSAVALRAGPADAEVAKADLDAVDAGFDRLTAFEPEIRRLADRQIALWVRDGALGIEENKAKATAFRHGFICHRGDMGVTTCPKALLDETRELDSEAQRISEQRRPLRKEQDALWREYQALSVDFFPEVHSAPPSDAPKTVGAPQPLPENVVAD